jgi:hypothetical protein
MISITMQHNIKCLKCLAHPEKLVRIGVFYMCDDCFTDEFKDYVSQILSGPTGSEIHHGDGIDPKGKAGKVYHKWLKKYFEKSEEEYFGTQ